MNTSLKTCFKCGAVKPMSAFYRHPRMSDGHLGKCKDCTKLDVKIRYYSEQGRIKVIAYEKARFKTKHRKEKVKVYQKARRTRNPEKEKARREIGNAIRDGRLVRKPCEICGNTKSEAHHIDYKTPLNVRWMCFKHHREISHGQKVNVKAAIAGAEPLQSPTASPR